MKKSHKQRRKKKIPNSNPIAKHMGINRSRVDPSKPPYKRDNNIEIYEDK
jgi:hypothetical protein